MLLIHVTEYVVFHNIFIVNITLESHSFQLKLQIKSAQNWSIKKKLKCSRLIFLPYWLLRKKILYRVSEK